MKKIFKFFLTVFCMEEITPYEKNSSNRKSSTNISGNFFNSKSLIKINETPYYNKIEKYKKENPEIPIDFLNCSYKIFNKNWFKNLNYLINNLSDEGILQVDLNFNQKLKKQEFLVRFDQEKDEVRSNFLKNETTAEESKGVFLAREIDKEKIKGKENILNELENRKIKDQPLLLDVISKQRVHFLLSNENLNPFVFHTYKKKAGSLDGNIVKEMFFDFLKKIPTDKKINQIQFDFSKNAVLMLLSSKK